MGLVKSLSTPKSTTGPALQSTTTMMRLGDPFPAISGEASAGGTHAVSGMLDIHAYWGDSWGILFSHPGDFTPVCTTELGTVARCLTLR